MTTLINGWEYLTNVVPGNIVTQTLQNEYLTEYSLAYHKFIQDICLPLDQLGISQQGECKQVYIDCNDDIIDVNNNYPVKFTKSKFLKNKHRKIKLDLYKYYNPNGILVKGPFELEANIFRIDLFVNKENYTETSSTS